jgi:L-fuconolactonase
VNGRGLLHHPARMIDAHQHLWSISERSYPWLTPEAGSLYGDFTQDDVTDDIARAGITGTVLVQAADNYDDTIAMLAVARQRNTVLGVVGWVPLDRPEEASLALDLLGRAPELRGIRALTHNYPDPAWLLRDDVGRGIAMLVQRGLTLDVVSALPEHLAAAVELARRHPGLTIVIDHLAGPHIPGGGGQSWVDRIADAAARPNLMIKLSGLATSAGSTLSSADWQPVVEHAIAHFGSERMMLGSDWPVCTQAGDLVRVWTAQRETISGLPVGQQDDILFRTAERVYSLPV